MVEGTQRSGGGREGKGPGNGKGRVWEGREEWEAGRDGERRENVRKKVSTGGALATANGGKNSNGIPGLRGSIEVIQPFDGAPIQKDLDPIP